MFNLEFQWGKMKRSHLIKLTMINAKKIKEHPEQNNPAGFSHPETSSTFLPLILNFFKLFKSQGA